ncbi:hypothetical protein [Streptomyces sp. bgisy034]|uniref:hypothetical protein n=1 Tax=Streptomyces sp. bgisy034 TaxID=3413774 RepID=UPI003EBDD9EC
MRTDEFNSLNPVGTPVFAYPGARPEDIPSARRLVTRTRTEAQTSASGDPVVWVEGEGAYICLTHVDVVTEAEYEAAKLADAVAEQGALPMPAGPEPQLTPKRLAEIRDLVRYESSIAFSSNRAKESILLLVAEAEEAERLRARVAAQDAQREALAERLRAGQRWQRGRRPELVSENLVSQSELRDIFGIPLVAPWANGHPGEMGGAS